MSDSMSDLMSDSMSDYELVPISEIENAEKVSWSDRLAPILSTLDAGTAIKIIAQDKREAQLIRASWRRLALAYSPHSYSKKDSKGITIYLTIDRQFNKELKG